jgi:hypothetical protein
MRPQRESGGNDSVVTEKCAPVGWRGGCADLFDVSRGTIRNAIDDVLPLLEEDGFQLPPSPLRLHSKAEVLALAPPTTPHRPTASHQLESARAHVLHNGW